ncbi:MAG TPA: aminoacyl-tRNA hydrolase [Pseudolabrys sp.]|jgi:PTH1 family peptidyl-tRNA hydrolase|nr:aminoacyl-tRNA hydrolase [Pseudolabrys sp.]
MLLFIGLGNPGPKHAGNRHNIGFMAVQAIARRHELSPWRRRFQGVAVEGNIAEKRILLLLPGTYMNESGRAVSEAANFYKLDVDSIVVFHDEVDLPRAKVRVKVGGGVAGHNGLRSITAHIGNQYKRVRIGIGKPNIKELVPMHVLADFAKSEWAWVEALCDVVADNAPLLVEGRDSSFQNKVHLAMEAKGFADEADDELSDSK